MNRFSSSRHGRLRVDLNHALERHAREVVNEARREGLNPNGAKTISVVGGDGKHVSSKQSRRLLRRRRNGAWIKNCS
jgi:hypothetical protein